MVSLLILSICLHTLHNTKCKLRVKSYNYIYDWMTSIYLLVMLVLYALCLAYIKICYFGHTMSARLFQKIF